MCIIPGLATHGGDPAVATPAARPASRKLEPSNRGTMTSREARRTFLDFFGARGHRVVPSSPLVLPADPTLLFANAGMNQFKDVFTGKEKRDYARAATSQKCMRVSGKHNDLEQVGRTPRHHTFFEMLGNFSFGDYFKADAIEFAWKLLTETYGIPESKLWVTIFGGSAAVPADEEAAHLWQSRVGVAPERILRLGEADNFWRMGETGPCGPCSEIHFDFGADLTSVPGLSTPETDSRRYVEIWNLVFMQFEQHADGKLAALPAPSIDTGMGLERIATVLQGKRSNYDTDLFRPILAAAAERAGAVYGADTDKDVSLRVIADHSRALAFLVADGIIPSNDKRGYVLRRILRRAIRHGRKLGIREPFLHDITPVVIEGLRDVYPEIEAARQAILEVARREEERFADTLAAGLDLLDQSFASLESASRVLPGADLFRLYDTFGFPLDLARDIAEERGVRLDEAGFEELMAKQRTRAQASWKGAARAAADSVWAPEAGRLKTPFRGYEALRLEAVPVVAVAGTSGPAAEIREGAEGELVLQETPFYAESGGQVGDTGWIVGGEGRLRVTATYRPAEGLIAHRVVVEDGRVAKGDAVLAEVDAERREAIRRNHTATHLLHAALREVVGTHVKQAGSLVAPDRLRFDFSHFAALSERTLGDIEALVNRKILADIAVATRERDLEEALAQGAMALFGEKYGDRVRVVEIGDFSLELCGGTHTARSGEIGLFKLTQERGVSAGTRRVEAVTGQGSLDRFREEHAVVKALEALLSVPRAELVAEISRRIEHARELERRLERERMKSVQDSLFAKADAPEVAGGIKVVAARADGLAAAEVRTLADNLRRRLGSGVVLLGRAEEGKVALLVAVTDDLTAKVRAGDLVREMAKVVGGGGGGRADIAEAGGKDAQRLDEALQLGRDLVARAAGVAR